MVGEALGDEQAGQLGSGSLKDLDFEFPNPEHI